MNHKKRIKALIKKTPSYDYQRQVMQKHGEFINELCKDRMEQVLYNYLGATMMVLGEHDEGHNCPSGPHHIQACYC